MSCCGNNSIANTQIGAYSKGLGQMDPATIAAIQQAFVHAKDLWKDMEQIFGIGAGRHEADVITPLQNDVTQVALVPAAAMTDTADQHSCSDFQQMLGALNAAESQFKNFIKNTTWQDGRAAQQALYWLTGTQGTNVGQPPYFALIKADFITAMNAKNCSGGIGGGIGGIITNPDGSMNWPVILGGAGLLYAISRRK